MKIFFFSQVDHFVVQPVFKKKNAELARAKRAEGNEAFQKKRYKQATTITFSPFWINISNRR